MSHTPKHAIREWLGGFSATWHPPGTEPSRMRPETVRFVKRKHGQPGQIWYITCDADGGPRGTERWRWTVVVSRGDQGRWTADGISGGSGEPCLRGRPCADLGGNWGRNGFRAGGTVEDAGAGIARVRLTDLEGHIFEDTVENGVILFSSDEPVAMPMRLELIDADGRVVYTDEWGFVDEW
jgi:hypothetical protein